MATDRKDSKVTRLDLRIPNDIYAQVEEIAKANNSPSHHITGNIILSPTLLKLISLGISSLSGNYSELANINPNISQLSDKLSPRVDMIEGELAEVKKSLIELSDKLSGMISDQISANISDTISDSIAMKVDMGQPSPPSPTLTATTATPSPTKKTLVGYPFGITEDN